MRMIGRQIAEAEKRFMELTGAGLHCGKADRRRHVGTDPQVRSDRRGDALHSAAHWRMIALLFITSVFVFFASLAYALGLLTGLAISSRSGRPDRKRAEEKGIALLRSWLTPNQATQWDLS